MKLLYGAIGLALIAAFFLWPHAEPESRPSPETTESSTATDSPSSSQTSLQTRKTASTAPEIAKVAPAIGSEPVARPSARERVHLPAATSNPEAEQRQRAALLKPFLTGQHVAVLGRDYEFLNLRAVSESQFREELGNPVAEEQGFVFYAPHSAGPSDFTVVTNPSNGRLGVVTGVLVVKLRDNADGPALVKNYALDLKATDEDLRLVYGQAPTGANLTSLAAQIQRDRRVESLQIEILQNRKRF